ncbi:MAG: cob(I)yrinic acid a,c-diamide adenosyltransferase [Planctomycetes bacterium]|nr:cob(I)yrinic acid a,c-diamide adenosyltransferase [Planctomycetota bacterium]
MRITRVTTGDGDGGDTGLGGGQVVSKDSLRIEALGGADELNALIGLALAGELAEDVAEELGLVQNDLFDLGADLAVLETDKAAEGACRIEGAQVDRLGNKIDTLQRELGPLEEFILPGGSAGAATLHLARTVCRRAERAAVALCREEAIGAQVIPYLNRLSDLLFVLARRQNQAEGKPETYWRKGAAAASASPQTGQ